MQGAAMLRPGAGGESHDFPAMIDTFASLDECLLSSNVTSNAPSAAPPSGTSFLPSLPSYGFMVPVPSFQTQPQVLAQQPQQQAQSGSQQAKLAPRKRGSGSDRRGGKLQVKDQISELEQQLQAKMDEARELESRNQKLRQRSRILELVIASRDRQVHTLRLLRQAALATRVQAASTQTSVAASPTASHAPSPPLLPVPAPISTVPFNPFVCQQPTGPVRVMSVMPDAPSGPLDPPNWTTLQMYAKCSLEQHMEIYTELVEILSAEMVKPGLGRTHEMMSNLGEFTRIIALMTDQLALLVTRDVRGVQELAMSAAVRASLQQLKTPAPVCFGPNSCGLPLPDGMSRGSSAGPQPGGLFEESSRFLAGQASGAVLLQANSSHSMSGQARSSSSIASGSSSLARDDGSGRLGSMGNVRVPEGGGPTSGSANTEMCDIQQQQQQQVVRGSQEPEPALESYKESLTGRVGMALAKATAEYMDAHKPLSAWLLPPERTPSLPEERVRPWNHPLHTLADSKQRAQPPATPSADPVALRSVWQSVVRALNMTEQQYTDAAMLVELHTGWMARVAEQRSWLSQELSKLLANKQFHSTGLRNATTETDIMVALEKNLRAEHAILMLVGEVFAFELLTREQSARVLIHSWPHISDYVAIMQCAVESWEQQLRQQQLLKLEPQ